MRFVSVDTAEERNINLPGRYRKKKGLKPTVLLFIKDLRMDRTWELIAQLPGRSDTLQDTDE